MKRIEIVPCGQAIWQSDDAKTYQCPKCARPIFSQYEGEQEPKIICFGPVGGHRLEWTTLTPVQKA
jgi:hypothetical protein